MASFVAALFVAACGQVTNSELNGQGPTVQPVARAPAQLLTQADFCPDAESPTCIPTGAHGALALSLVTGHAGFACKECHYVGGRLAFWPASKGGHAFLPGGTPAPFFDATAKTCSNIACHSMPAGTYSYYFPGGDGEPVLNTVSYGGGAPRPTPSWYATGSVTCTACHEDPPRNGSNGSNVWHSGVHGNQGPTGARNQCQFCHPGAFSPNNGIGTSNTNHNGTLNIQATFTSACFGCH